jgi:thiamine biosynthesis lipoprotein
MIRHAEHVMGTVFSFAVRNPGEGERYVRITDGLNKAIARLHHLDAVFSTYREDSPISRMARKEQVDYDAEIAEVLDRCREVEAETDGWFTAYPDGRLDPSGWVKGWAIQEASRLLSEAGAEDHCVTGGGDVQAVGEAAPGRPWRIGIADPLRAGQLATVVEARDLAVATSGVAERGSHIINPHTGKPAEDLLSMTLIGERIARVDAWATAAFAMGPVLGLKWAEHRAGVEALAILPDGSKQWTSGFPALS